MNVIRTTVTRVAVQPNGSPHAPYVQAFAQSGTGKVAMKKEHIADSTIHFERSEQVFELIEALNVVAVEMRGEEEAARARGGAAINAVRELIGDPPPVTSTR